jgi:glyoxylase-like metal-dependent hydrolase (beta-lactamase superfamily II)
MNTGSFRFKVGTFECVSISDGNFNYPVESFFANVPTKQIEATLHQHALPLGQIATPYTCLYINTWVHRVLIDTGAGNIGIHAAKFFPNVDHSTTITGTLLANMKVIGIQPTDIDVVIITHAHPDHIGGTLDETGKLIFANASYFIQKEEWEFWTSDMATTKAPTPMIGIARNNLEPLRGRLNYVDNGFEIVPGIRAIATPGHTPGHIALSVSSAGEQLLHISDVVIHPLHLEHPTWVPNFDTVPEQAGISKRRIFNQAAMEKALVFAHHFPPFPNLGHVTQKGEGWQWNPIEIKGRNG